MPSIRPNTEQRTHTIAVLVALAGAAGVLLFLILGSGVTAARAPGVVQTTEIKIALEISGRLGRFSVTQGQSVHQGDDLVELVNPELAADGFASRQDLDEATAAVG